MSAPKGYSRIQIILHWLVAALIALQFIFADFMSDAWEAVEHGLAVGFSPLVAAHVFGGLAVLLLAFWRLQIRLRRGAPLPPAKEHPLLQRAAGLAHWAFYALMIIVPASGAAAWFGGIEAAAEAHEVFKTMLLVLIAIHALAALYHQFVLKTNLIARMKQAQA